MNVRRVIQIVLCIICVELLFCIRVFRVTGLNIEELIPSNTVFTDDELSQFVTYQIEDDQSIRGLRSIRAIGYTYIVDMEGLQEYLTSLNESAITSVDAYIIKTEKGFEVVPEVYGTVIGIEQFLTDLVLEPADSLSVSDYYVLPTVKSRDLKKLVIQLNSYTNWVCVYGNDDIIEASTDYVDYIDNEIVLNTDWIAEAVKAELDSYNTVGQEREFTTSSDEVITLSTGTWGSSVDYEAEIEILTDLFLAGKSEYNREPEFEYYREDIGGTYVEVSITDQYVWVYVDNEVVMDTDCVTGNTSLGHDTPTGIYYISECINGKYLKGDGYTTWVNKWMRLTNSGVGLHDAYWRSSFGGNIYTYNGSHGCINLPKSFAYDLYDIAYVGMPVIIY